MRPHEVHGMTKHPLYTSWRAMRNRCIYTVDPQKVKSYRGKGITICEEWTSFTKFAGWAFLNGYEPGLTIDRINPDGNYCPENCRWATPFEQGQTKGNKAKVEINGVSRTVSQWARHSGLSVSTVFRRYYKGIRDERLIAPIDKARSNKK
jgi:hypothetical protein